MSLYMSQFSYTAEAWTRQIENPQNRAEVIRQLLERMGGRLLYFFHSLGDYEGLSILELPDDVSTATFVGAAITAGHLTTTNTTTLINPTGFLQGGTDVEAPEGNYYLLQTAYTAEAWASMVHRPQDRMAAVQPVAQRLGGSVAAAWLSFGEYDVVTLIRMPDLLSAAAFVRAMSAGGALKTIKTTLLLTPEENLEVLRRAGRADYQPPRE